MPNAPYTVVLIVPTGIGAAIGGYAGDALPVARAVAAIADCVITHPNVLNGAQLYWSLPNVLYVEGYGLDRFAAGAWGLRPVRQNRVGILFDQAIEPDLRLRHVQAADATRATLGLDLTDYVVTDAPLGVTLRTAPSGATWGTIERPDSLLRAAEKLIHQAGAEAIAVVARFPDDCESAALQAYRHGQGVDPLAGAEAVISHLIVREFQIPCAHAPALLPLPLDPNLSPRSAAEELGYTFLPCVLVGLSRAPQFANPHSRSQTMLEAQSEHSHQPAKMTDATATIWANQVNAVIVPATACGGSGLMHLSQPGIKIIAVQENQTKMQVPPEALGIGAIRVNSYLEALGILVCDRAGIAARSLHPHIKSLGELP
jgi:predicted Fe-Mo cluster-binding NifX family protein